MEPRDVIIAVTVMIIVIIIYLVMTQKITLFGSKAFNTASKMNTGLQESGENAINMANKQAPTYDITKLYSNDTLQLIATFLGTKSVQCSNKATGFVKTTEHSIEVVGVLPNHIYCAMIESQHAPDRPFRHPYFFVLFREEQEGKMTYLHIVLVDSGEKVHYAKIVIPPDIDAKETTIYFDKLKYLTGRSSDSLDTVRAKLFVTFKRDEDKGEDSVYIVSYIMGMYDT